MPVNVSETSSQFPWEGSCEEVILVSFKKNSFKGHEYLEPVMLHIGRAAM